MQNPGNLFRICAFVFTVGFFLVEGPGVPLAQASSIKDEDFAIWNTYDLEKRINKQWKIRAGEELRFRENSGLYYAETHVGSSYQPCKYLALGVEYLEIRGNQTKKQKQIWYWESEPRIFITPQISYRGFTLENRNMMEFRIRQDTRYSTRYRNLVALTAPWKWTRFEFQPYISNEIFFETGKNGLVEDRLSSGLKAHWWGPFYGSIYYLRDSTKNSAAKWTSLNILGTGLKVSF